MKSNGQNLSINSERLLNRIRELGQIGRDEEGKLMRLAASASDKAGRDIVITWMKDAGLEIVIDRIGNIFGIWSNSIVKNYEKPGVCGWRVDTGVDAGGDDGRYGVLSGMEVVKTLQEAGFVPTRPIVVAAFTNEEGVRYTPDMMGSLVYAGGLSIDEALATIGNDGTQLGTELEKIGYAGTEEPGFLHPHAFLELHIEQGPVLANADIPISAVENLQGISWQRITIEGAANHAGTTPMETRRDAGYAAARVITFLRDQIITSNESSTVATVGSIHVEPNAINVIPSRAMFTVDLRNPNEQQLQNEEAALADFLEELADAENVTISSEKLARFEPVIFDEKIVNMIENAADQRNLKSKRMTSGAGHDAQMMARICPTAMIFVPSKDGISHNPKEFTSEADLVAGANVLLDVVSELAGVERWK